MVIMFVLSLVLLALLVMVMLGFLSVLVVVATRLLPKIRWKEVLFGVLILAGATIALTNLGVQHRQGTINVQKVEAAAQENLAEKSSPHEIEEEQETGDDVQSAAQSAAKEEPQEAKSLPANPAVAESNSDENRGIVYIPKNRPSWLETEPEEIGERFRVVVSSGPWARASKCSDELSKNIRRAVDHYIERYINRPDASRFVSFNSAYTHNNLLHGPIYQETVRIPDPVGLMKQHHARLEFDQSFRDEVSRRWQEVVVKNRLQHTGIGFGGVIGFLMTVVLFFKLDTATKGYYTRRLKFAAQAMILVLIGIGVILSIKIPWL